MFDCYGGEIIALVMDTNMKKELCMKTVEETYKARNPGNGVIIHSDSGSQYTSGKYKELLGKHLAVQSMSDVAKCYDNSRMESWFATLKKEKLYKINTANMTVEEVKQIELSIITCPNICNICAPNNIRLIRSKLLLQNIFQFFVE